MPRFHIYPKKGERFDLEFERFRVNEETHEIELHDERGQVFGALVAEYIAAVIPAELRPTQRLDMLTFTVYFKSHLSSPFQINGTHFVRESQGYSFRLDGRPVPLVYINPQEIAGLTYAQTN